jgi:hypothetical protein
MDNSPSVEIRQSDERWLYRMQSVRSQQQRRQKEAFQFRHSPFPIEAVQLVASTVSQNSDTIIPPHHSQANQRTILTANIYEILESLH